MRRGRGIHDGVGLMVLSLRPRSGAAFADWDELFERVGRLLPRVEAVFGVQEIWTHDRFFLRAMVTELPAEEFRLTVFGAGGIDPADDPQHPVWPLVARLAARNDWLVWRWRRPGEEEPVAIPPGALERPAPPDHTDRMHAATPAVDLTGLDDVPWGELTHAFGPATDVPDLIRALASADPHARRQALRHLYGNVYHQGSTYPATVAVVPFLLRILADPPPGAAADVASYLCTIAETDVQVIEAVLPALPLLADLAGRPGETGLWARRTVGCLARVSDPAADRVEAYLRAEPDPVARADWLLWLSELDDARRWSDVAAEYLDAPQPLVRLAAAIAVLSQDVVMLPALDVAFGSLADPQPYKAWADEPHVWRWNGNWLHELAFDTLVMLDRDRLDAIVADLGGQTAAEARWPELRTVTATRR
jgi:hypothetical protein